ncbi:MAG: hypothetical protein ABIR23_03245 [Novosphingobium sp.]
MAAVAGLALTVSIPAFASSDYLLEIDDYAETGKPVTIEVQSWSWGASNPSSIGSSGMSAGRRMHKPRLAQPLAAGGSVSVVTAREAGSGMATGRRSCATGKHFPKATLTNKTQTWLLKDVVVTTCADDGMTLDYATAEAVSPATDDAKITKSRSNIQNN